jgi:hypothetical protein
MVKPGVLAVAVVSLLVGGAVTFAVIRMVGKGSPELAFVVGAVLGTQLAAVVHHRTPGAASSSRVKAAIGVALACGVVVLGAVLHLAFAPFEFAWVSIPIAAVGAFVFPFVLFDTMWNALTKKRNG